MSKSASRDHLKPVRWVGSSKEDLSDFPADVRRRVGGAATPKGELELIDRRLRRAREDYEQWSKKREAHFPVTAGSGNVFADIGLPEPDEELTKAQLASHIRQSIRRQRLTQVAAATQMGIDQPKVSALLNGRLANFSSDRLMRLLTALGQDVDITVRDKPRGSAHGRIRVVGEARSAAGQAAGGRRTLSTPARSESTSHRAEKSLAAKPRAMAVS